MRSARLPLLDGGKGLGRNLLMQFSTLGSSEIFKTDFFDVLTMHSDQMCFHPIWVLEGGGGASE